MDTSYIYSFLKVKEPRPPSLHPKQELQVDALEQTAPGPQNYTHS